MPAYDDSNDPNPFDFNYPDVDYEDYAPPQDPDDEEEDHICRECDGDGTVQGQLCKSCQGTGRT
jgi:RecJ-like exonuclease